ncbi:hypothetical protein BC937DRAFT_88943 [Endogone sp. FLAS-F59071]|nr:hypothetical protein BC937DRAFT_88943 [Endogone sp. FLAS-F59071]|eukprot:RUS18305.1 hypothetical protein BC937DRAFT_88943 [Endogone sp. FLAS-F59071]
MSSRTWLKVESAARVRAQGMIAYKLTRCLDCSAFDYKMVKISNPPIKVPTSDIFDKFTVLWILLLLLFLYVAKGYPSWRKTRTLPTDAIPSASTSCSPTVAASTTASTTAAPMAVAPIASTNQPPQKASEPHKLWLIIALPLIIPYLTARAALDLFRLSVYNLFQAIEWTGVALAKFALRVATESLTIEALGIWLHDHGLPALRFLGQKLREHGMLALARACEGAFYWTVFCWAVFFCVRAAAWAQLIGTRLFRFWVEIGKPWLDKILAGAKLWVLDPLIWVVTRGVYLVVILYEASTPLAVAVWNEIVDLGQFIAWLAVWVWELGKRLAAAAIFLGQKLIRTAIFFVTCIQFVYAGTLAAMHWTYTHIVLSDTYKWLSFTIIRTYIHLTSTLSVFATRLITFLWSVEHRDFICNCLVCSAIVLYNVTTYIVTALIKQCWRALTGPTMQQLALVLYGHLNSETTQKFLIDLSKRSAVAAIFWGQESIRTAIFFVSCIQFVYAETVVAWHWTHTHVVLPLSYLLPDTYRQLSSASVGVYIHVTSHLFVFATFLHNHLVRPAIFLVHPALVHVPIAIMSVTAYYALHIGPACASVQVHVVIIAARVAEITGPVLTKAAKAAERLVPEIMKARVQLARQADWLVEWVANTLMEWVKRETPNESMSKGQKGKAE